MYEQHALGLCQYDPTCDLKINVSHCDFISWSSDFALYLEDYLMYEHHTFGLWVSMSDVWPQNKCRSQWPIFHGSVILPYILKTIWFMNIILLDYESVWLDIWPQNKYRSLWPILHGPVILSYVLKTIFDISTPYFWSMSQYDPMFDLKTFVGHCDLYFKVQWFCFIFWKLFSGWTSYFGIMSRYDPTSDLKIFVGHCDLYFIVYWICIISWRLFDVWTSYFGVMCQYDSPFDLEINVGYCNLYFMVHWFRLIS